MLFQILISLEEDGTGLVIHRNWYFHRNELSPLWCDLFTSLMRKVRDLFFLQEGSRSWRSYSPSATAASQIKWLICDVITDSHLIVGTRNRTSNPQERIFPSKWSESSVIWYLCIADEKGERFNPVPAVIQYLMEVFTKSHCCYPKWSH